MSGESFFRAGGDLKAIAGQRIEGGCDDCSAFQTLAQPSPGVYVLRVHHDETCPTYVRIKGGAS